MNILKFIVVLLSILFVVSCGVDGPPIAPSAQVD